MKHRGDRRAGPRYAVDLPSWIRLGDGRLTCRLKNVSSSGALVGIDAKLPLKVGDTVELEVAGRGTITGSIIRMTATHFAIAFPGAVVISRFADS